jgi:hypothetical protein
LFADHSPQRAAGFDDTDLDGIATNINGRNPGY